MKEELKPCPFCGSDAEWDGDNTTDISWSMCYMEIKCTECEAQTATFFPDNKFNRESVDKCFKDCYAAWDRRVNGE